LGVVLGRVKGDVSGDAGVEPERGLRRRQRGARAFERGGIERRRRGI